MLLLSLLLIVFTSLVLLFLTKSSKTTTPKSKITRLNKLPKPYPIIGHLLPFIGLTTIEIFEWLSEIIATGPTSTIVVHNPFGLPSVYTGDPDAVEHILKTQFLKYVKGTQFKLVFGDLFGDSMFTEDGDNWKVQRQITSQEFTHKALKQFVENIVKFEISERLIPVLEDAAKTNKVIDLQNVLHRFAFDNVCMVATGYDPKYLSLPFPDDIYMRAFDDSINLCHTRFHAIFPIIWKACRFLNIGSEKKLKDSVQMIRESVSSMIQSNKLGLNKTSSENDKPNLTTRILKEGRYDDKIIIDGIITFIFGGRDTTSAALTWFFWLLHNHTHVEHEIINEINAIKTKTNSNTNLNSLSSTTLEQVKGMTYTHAALSESLRLYPSAAADFKQAASDDVLPDGTKVKKGAIVGIFTYAMGRSEKIWGPDWPQFRPERWLKEEKDNETGKLKRSFMARDAYSYPVFLAGPRICLGKDMAYLQMKSIVAAVLSRFKVVPAVDGFDPVYLPETIARMDGGFPVRIQERI